VAEKTLHIVCIWGQGAGGPSLHLSSVRHGGTSSTYVSCQGSLMKTRLAVFPRFLGLALPSALGKTPSAAVLGGSKSERARLLCRLEVAPRGPGGSGQTGKAPASFYW
jgi:hypothetical protein